MCNLSEVVLERGRKQGIEEGIEQVAEQMLKANKPVEEIEKFTRLSVEKLEKLADKLGVATCNISLQNTK